MLFRRAEETRLVAADYVSLPQFRDGRPRALSDPDIRGYAPSGAAWPITFETGSAELTDKGRQAIEDVVEPGHEPAELGGDDRQDDFQISVGAHNPSSLFQQSPSITDRPRVTIP